MTKAELLKVLKPFTDDIEIYVCGTDPQVFYHKQGKNYPGFINLEDDWFQQNKDDVETVKVGG